MVRRTALLAAAVLLAAGCGGVVGELEDGGGSEDDAGVTGGGGGSATGGGGGSATGGGGGSATGGGGGSATGGGGGSATGGGGGSATGGGGGSATGGGGGSATGGGGGSATGGGGGSATGGGGGSATGGGGGSTPSGYGVPVDGYPSWRERAILALTNAVRISPGDYKVSSVYATRTPTLNRPDVLGTTYPARSPILHHHDLARAARFHAQDMASKNYFSHTSQDGSSFSTRVRRYYTASSTLGENIAAGNVDPISTMHQWLCDVSGGTCCVDGQSCDGHRRGIMNGSFRALGVGYGYDSTAQYDHYWVQDFGGVAGQTAPRLVDGAHLLRGTGQTRFIANYASTTAAASVTLMLDGVSTPMAQDLGTATGGTWFVEVARGTGCRSYYFTAEDTGGGMHRYPAAGQFRTAGEGSCAEEFVP
jgi:hypothetical protein